MEYLNHLDLMKYSINTKQTYLRYENLFKHYSFDQEGINNFLARYNHQVARSFLKSYLSFCGAITLIPLIPKIKGRRYRLMSILTKDEIYKMIELASPELGLMIGLMFESGLRVSELVNLKKNNIDIITGKIRAIGKGNKEFEMPLTSATLEALKYHIATLQREELFDFGGVIHKRQCVWYIIKKMGLELFNKRVTPHTFRHSLGTYLIEKDTNIKTVQMVLRHENLATTDRYVHGNKKKMEADYKDIMELS